MRLLTHSSANEKMHRMRERGEMRHQLGVLRQRFSLDVFVPKVVWHRAGEVRRRIIYGPVTLAGIRRDLRSKPKKG